MPRFTASYTTYRIPRAGKLVKDDALLLLLAHKHPHASTAPHRANEEVIPNDIQLLLVVARCIARTCQPRQIDQRRAADVVRDAFEGELEGVAEQSE
jgi:hypothetical protein